MELEFDKEIDALLRKAGGGDSAVITGAPASGHLDADELAAFAENALPEQTRQFYVAHLADCDRCRKMLSGFISLSSEAASEAAFAAAGAPSNQVGGPWYRRLFAMPNLAYTMGALVILFSGFIGYLVLQRNARNVEVSHVVEQQPVASAPATDERQQEFSNASTATSNTMANTNSSSSIESVTKSGVEVGSATPPSVSGEDRTAAGNEVARNEPSTVAAAPQPPPKEAPPLSTERDTKLEAEKQVKTAEKDKEVTVALADESKMKRSDDQRTLRELSPSAKTGPSRAAGPRQQMNTQNNVTTTQNQLEGLTSTGRAVGGNILSTRSAGGKTFELKSNVWYDTAYRGQGTKSIKRGTEKFLRLDEGLRNIADHIGGTVVVVWKDNAYRIQ